MAPHLMRKPPPAAAELEARAQDIRNGAGWNERKPAALWEAMLDLISTGQMEHAWRFFEAAWPPAIPGRAKFLAGFRSQLQKSPYWPAVKAMNGP